MAPLSTGKTVVLFIASLIVTIITAITGLYFGVMLGANSDITFDGVRGYEAGGALGVLIGAFLGALIGTYLMLKRDMAKPPLQLIALGSVLGTLLLYVVKDIPTYGIAGLVLPALGAVVAPLLVKQQ